MAALQTRKGHGLLGAVLLMAAVWAGCGQKPDRPRLEIIPLRAFPQEAGRGFPQAVWVETTAEAAVGQPAPNFAFALSEGQGTTLAALQGRTVVINFWATWCAPCRREMPEFVALSQEDPEVVVLAVNVEEPLEVVRPFAQEFGLPFPVVLDPSGMVRRAYGVRGLPVTVFVGSDGRVGARWNGMLSGSVLRELVAEVRAP